MARPLATPETRLKRFRQKYVELPDGCWLWTSTRIPSGYGYFYWAPKTMSAHRAAHLLFIGPIPESYEVDHLCKNRGCVNPAHLEAVTLQENRRRRDTASGNRTVNGRKTHCIHGHPLSGANLFMRTGGKKRGCRACEKARHARQWKSRQAKQLLLH